MGLRLEVWPGLGVGETWARSGGRLWLGVGGT